MAWLSNAYSEQFFVFLFRSTAMIGQAGRSTFSGEKLVGVIAHSICKVRATHQYNTPQSTSLSPWLFHLFVVPVFADVITNMTCNGSRSPQEPDVLSAHLRVNTKLVGGRVNCA